MKLRLPHAERTGLQVHIGEGEASELAPSQSRCVQENDRKAHRRSIQREMRRRGICRGDAQHPGYLRWPEDDRLPSLDTARKMTRIRHEGCRIETPAIQAELMHDQGVAAPPVRVAGAARAAPRLEVSCVEVRRTPPLQMLGEGPEHPRLAIVLTTDRVLVAKIALHGRFEHCRFGGASHGAPPRPAAECTRGTGSATSRSSSVLSRK
jgi:hypothetical protein